MFEARRLKALGDENAKLKRLLAEKMLDLAAMWDLPGGRSGRYLPLLWERVWQIAAGRLGPCDRRKDRKDRKDRALRAVDT